ncbi:MAG: putative manganese transporter, partial [Paracoccaceae bacterium]
TMVDAAVLLIATRHDVAMVVLPMSFAIGILSGWVVDAFSIKKMVANTSAQCELAPLIGQTRLRDYAFLVSAAPGLMIGITQLSGANVYAVYGSLVTAVGLIGTAIGLSIWAASTVTAMTNQNDSPFTRMAEETAFISVWVIGAYLAYDYIVAFSGLDLETMFSTVAPLLPLIGVIIGLVPGCGPQVLVTTLYINGLIPFAALMGNAISNDGDALFPAIALNPRAAILATAYSTVPAMMAAYGFYFFAPGFLN